MHNVVAGTGHRPQKLGGYGEDVRYKLNLLALNWLDHYRPFMPVKVISGMALGWDQALALAAHLRKIPIIAAVPFPNYESKWPKESIDNYRSLLDLCEEVVYVSNAYTGPHVMQLRNEWMVDRCNLLLALWDGSPKSGTGNCIRYAKKLGVPIENLWDKFHL